MALAGLLLIATTGRSAMFPADSWTLTDAAGVPFGQAQDNDIETGLLLQSSQSVVRCVIDLGSAATVHRVFFTAADRELNPGAGGVQLTRSHSFTISLRAGNSPAPQGAVLASRQLWSATSREIRVQANLRIQPVTARYLVLELERGALTNRWNLGEVEVYGWPGDWTASRGDAVVLATGAPAPLKLAADELSYYLGELSGHPVPIVAPDQASSWTGSLFRIVDLKPLALTYEDMTNHMAQGLFPSTPVNVERDGRELVFRAWPYRNVLWSVWEFLDRQGVKWLYPDAHGDYVPTGQGLNLDVAPLHFTPSCDFIYANFGVEFLRDDPDAFLHFWRNRWTHTWGGHQRDAFDGTEVPAKPRPPYTPKPEYAEGFYGYPHNFNNVIPGRILAEHPAWCGMLTNEVWSSWIGAENLGRRMLPSESWCNFDLTNPEARQFIIDKAIYTWNEHAKWVGNIYWLLPEDSMLFSEDAASVALRAPLEDDPVPFTFPYPYSASGDYYDFVCHIARGIQTALPEAKVGAMAYSNTHRPPPAASPFPSNVLVDICMYGVRNLPLSSPKNAEMRARLQEWAALATERRHYDYDLIHCESGPLPMPVPLVSSTEDRARFFHQLGMMAGGTQADLATLPYNPWNFYAYPRFYWNLDLDSGDVLREFFNGYYREAAAPMLSYYNTLERFLIANNVSLQERGYDYGLMVGAYPISVLKKMHQHLLRAEDLATTWVVKQRVARARAGLDWILERRGLTYDDLASSAGFPSVGPGDTVTIDLREAQIQTAGQDVGDAWFLFSWAQVGDYVHFEKPGRYEIRIEAGIGYPDPAPHRREMLFHIGSLEYGPFLIDHEDVETYTLIVEVPAGIMEVAVEDLHNDGPFKVSTITIEGADDGPVLVSLKKKTAAPHVYDFAADGNPAERIDSDWDGTADLFEMLAGTDELDPDSFFALHSLVPDETGLMITWPSVPGKRYALYRSASLTQADFELIADNLTATPPENAYADLSPSTETAFYQIAVY